MLVGVVPHPSPTVLIAQCFVAHSPHVFSGGLLERSAYNGYGNTLSSPPPFPPGPRPPLAPPRPPLPGPRPVLPTVI